MLWHGKNFRGIINKAKEMIFDNTGTDLISTNAEDAIKEVNSNKPGYIGDGTRVHSDVVLSNGTLETVSDITDNCWLQAQVYGSSGNDGYVSVDNIVVAYVQNSNILCTFPVKAGQVVRGYSYGTNGRLRFFKMS